MVKKVHWTQTPDGRKRMREILMGRYEEERKKAQKKRLTNKRVTKQPDKIHYFTPDRSLLTQLAELKKAASTRIDEIDTKIIELEKEREEILANFPEFRKPNRTLREVREG